MGFIKYLTDVEAQKYWSVKNYDNVANIEAAEAASMNSKDRIRWSTKLLSKTWSKQKCSRCQLSTQIIIAD